ncbi:MAG: response regulator [Bacteriovorax sp.]|nr:response regulator [Bacteriovorax sp.]
MRLKVKASKSVLIVDDETDVLELFKESLEDLSCQVFTANDGQKALSFLASNKVDFIVTDISMPNMTGLEFISLLHERSDLTPFFFITGYHDYPREDLNRYKPRAIIFKPFDFAEAAMLVKNHLMRLSKND